MYETDRQTDTLLIGNSRICIADARLKRQEKKANCSLIYPVHDGNTVVDNQLIRVHFLPGLLK